MGWLASRRTCPASTTWSSPWTTPSLRHSTPTSTSGSPDRCNYCKLYSVHSTKRCTVLSFRCTGAYPSRCTECAKNKANIRPFWAALLIRPKARNTPALSIYPSEHKQLIRYHPNPCMLLNFLIERHNA